MAKLVICEKPSVAEKIAHALGKGGDVSKKMLHGVPYYEVGRDGVHLTVVSAVGHLYTLREVKRGMGYPTFDIEWAPTYEVESGSAYSKKYLDTIRELGKGADEYIVACDFDIEGSLIGYNIMRFGCNSESGTRMKFSALTEEDLEAAFTGRMDFDIENALAGEARHMLDWYYGINLSRALMASIRGAGASYKQIMSIGRVQGPALAILAKKEKSIASFTSQPYWEVKCIAKGVQFGHAHGRFMDKAAAKAALEGSKSPGVVKKMERREYAQPPPPPFDLTSLQVEAYGLFGFAPALTLELAQSLYEATLISYPRTSSQKIPARLNLKKIIESLAGNPDYAAAAKSLISASRFVPLEGKKSDPAHPAIHPTGRQNNMLADKERKLYDLIVRRFLACFALPARREAQKVGVLSGTEMYGANGSRTVFPGWFDIYAPYMRLGEATLPPFSEGEEVELSKFMIDEKKTQPPKRYTPASIISELEKIGLGTKATRATIIETLFKRGYVEGTSIKATSFGMAVYDLLSGVAPEILDEKLTRDIEKDMEKIKDGENEKRVIENGKRLLIGILGHFEGKEKDIGFGLLSGLKQKAFSESVLGKCVKCGGIRPSGEGAPLSSGLKAGGDLRVIHSKLGKQFVGCMNYPECKAIYPLPQNAKIVPLGKACEKCGTPTIRVIRKAKKSFEMCIDPACETKKGWVKPAPPATRATAPVPAQPSKPAKSAASSSPVQPAKVITSMPKPRAQPVQLAPRPMQASRSTPIPSTAPFAVLPSPAAAPTAGGAPGKKPAKIKQASKSRAKPAKKKATGEKK